MFHCFRSERSRSSSNQLVDARQLIKQSPKHGIITDKFHRKLAPLYYPRINYTPGLTKFHFPNASFYGIFRKNSSFLFFFSLSLILFENTKYQRFVGELTSRLTDELFWLKLLLPPIDRPPSIPITNDFSRIIPIHSATISFNEPLLSNFVFPPVSSPRWNDSLVTRKWKIAEKNRYKFGRDRSSERLYERISKSWGYKPAGWTDMHSVRNYKR